MPLESERFLNFSAADIPVIVEVHNASQRKRSALWLEGAARANARIVFPIDFPPLFF